MAHFQMDNYHPPLYVPGTPIEAPKTKWIWRVFWIMLIVTIFEISFAFANGEYHFIPWTAQKVLFIMLTLVKAYYIIFYFMHLGHEQFNFRLTISLTSILLIYFIVLLMIEGDYSMDYRLLIPEFIKEMHTYRPEH
ncbi:MAG: cytochrome C oxidase subunit IV family protein [Flavobacteriales bacterium]|nr:cytochrome C oxidase subunit IV family protein [Flavobacteriales bacterium]MCX7769066.1 cytochrome C oxidase subunit IV family protein [Flavobacteriales bacterium]MDW8410745.1 cytochrome C oxidase subunit IV family protein [Flavobacteriales bacterium]